MQCYVEPSPSAARKRAVADGCTASKDTNENRTPAKAVKGTKEVVLATAAKDPFAGGVAEDFSKLDYDPVKDEDADYDSNDTASSGSSTSRHLAKKQRRALWHVLASHAVELS